MDVDSKSGFTIKTFAPSKVILAGEHSVVNGHCALALAVNFGVTVTLVYKPNCLNTSLIITDSCNRHFTVDWLLEDLLTASKKQSAGSIETIKSLCVPRDSYCDKASMLFLLLLYRTECSSYPFECKVLSSVPISGGLGSSASFSAALATAFLTFKRIYFGDKSGHLMTSSQCDTRPDNSVSIHTKFDLKPGLVAQINDLCFHCEKISHGNPSGLDNNIVVRGGLILFSENKITEHCNDEKFISYLDEVWDILLIDSCVKRDTKKFVAKVQAIRNEYKPVIEKIFEAMSQLSEEIYFRVMQGFQKVENDPKDKLNLLRQTWENVQTLISINQNLLESIGASSPELNRIVFICKEFGFAAKLTGAGGGGAALCLVPKSHKNREKLVQALIDNGFQCHFSKVEKNGVSAELLFKIKS